MPTAKFQCIPTALNAGPGDETAADPEKPAQDPNQEPDDNQVNRTDVRPRDREMHREEDHSERPRKRRKRKVVTISRRTAWPMIKPMETRA